MLVAGPLNCNLPNNCPGIAVLPRIRILDWRPSVGGSFSVLRIGVLQFLDLLGSFGLVELVGVEIGYTL